MYARLPLLICCCFFLIAGRLDAQLSSDSIFARYNRAVPQEKIYVHFDNSLYAPGQTVWYKAYLRTTRPASTLSRNIYIDWVDGNGTVISRNVAPVTFATATGSFEIPANYTGSSLHAVAYTKWMLNFDSSFLFHSTLRITSRSSAAATNNGRPTLHFFAESGNMVPAVPAVIAFKALDANGYPQNVRGSIVDQQGRPVAAFATVHDGMGTVSFTPAAGAVYTAEWADATGNIIHEPLPAVSASGVSINLRDGSIDRPFTVQWSPDIPTHTSKLQVIVHAGQKVLFKGVADISGKQNIKSNLPAGRFPSGVYTLTVLDESNQPLAERVFFVNNEEYLVEPGVRFDTTGLGKRAKNVFEIEVPDSLPASLSVAVTAAELDTDSSQNMITGLLLSPELKGHIHRPAYYFSSGTDSLMRQLDLVMLTNGWRRFNWSYAVTGALPQLSFQREEQYLTLKGTLQQTSGADQLARAKTINIVLQSRDSTRSLVTLPFQQNSFEYAGTILFDTTTVFYQLDELQLKGQTRVTLNNTLLPWVPGRKWTLEKREGMNLAPASVSLPPQYRQNFAGQTLDEVTVRAKKTKTKSRLEQLNDQYTSGFFKSSPSTDFNLVDNPNIKAGGNIFSYLESKVAGLHVKYSDTRVILTWRGMNSFRASTPVAVLINEIVVAPEQLLNLNMTDVAYIKAFRPPFLGLPMGNGGTGAIALYTRSGQDRKEDETTGMDNFLFAGYSPIKQFYAPDYGEQGRTYTDADLRPTLLWKPDIMTDGDNNKIRLVFYNNDVSKSFRVTIQGLMDDGRIVHYSKILR
jgi:hypothetical protein